MEPQAPDRVGLYIKPDTRNKLNVFKAHITHRCGHVISQDDAINLLLDSVDEAMIIEVMNDNQRQSA